MDHLTYKQIAEWEAFDRLEPIGTWRQDFRFAQLSSLIMNLAIKIYGKKGSSQKELSPIDFMPKWDEIDEEKKPKKQSVKQMKEVLMQIADKQNKKVNWRQKQTKKLR